MWTCDVIAGLKFLEEITGKLLCLDSIRPVEGTSIILFKTTGGDVFAYNYNTRLLESGMTKI